jgi:N-acetylmuramoyl-L-alanine amidase
MLDPGHGNANGGAYGRGGTIERDVNLHVATYLKKMLEEKGATVYMIREGVNSTWWNDSMGYVYDLAMRCRIRDSIQPDLFLSIHHNGTADGNKTDNIPKVFYPVSDPGASLDIAQCINSAFTERLGLGISELACANYYVLRKPSVPTVLGEASYLSNAEMESMLNDTNVLKYEAKTYLEGICAWVEDGLVSIKSIGIDTATSMMTINIKSDSVIDPLLTQVHYNGTELPGMLLGDRYIVHVPDYIPNGKQQFTVVAMNRNGCSSMKKDVIITINRKPADIKIISNSKEYGNIVKISAIVSDMRGCSIIDSTIVVCNQDTGYTKGGEALFYIEKKDVTDSLLFSCMSIVEKVKIGIPPADGTLIQGFVYGDENEIPVVNCSINTDTSIAFTDRFGFFSVSTNDVSYNSGVMISANGYSDTLVKCNIGIVNKIILSPVDSGVLIGKRIVIDPEFGGTETGGINKRGIRASDINQAIAKNIASVLEHHGADVTITRLDDRTVTLTDRLEIAEKRNAQCYIIIRTDSLNTDPEFIICQGSTYGRKIAESMKSYWKKITGETVPVREDVSFILQQTSCPAISLSLYQFNGRLIFDSKKNNSISQMVVNGLKDYFRARIK